MVPVGSAKGNRLGMTPAVTMVATPKEAMAMAHALPLLEVPM
jgi:hypothetical protein